MTQIDTSADICPRCGNDMSYWCGCTTSERLDAQVDALLAERDALRAEVERLKGRGLWGQYSPSYGPFIEKAKADWKESRKWVFDSSHDVSEVLPDGTRRKVGTFHHASDAEEAEMAVNGVRSGRLVESLKAQPMAVTVRPLEWRERIQKEKPLRFMTNSTCGKYSITEWIDGSGRVMCFDTPFVKPERIDAPDSAGGVEPLKDAAQADYEARILSAITARTEDEVRNEAIEAAARALEAAILKGVFVGKLPDHIRALARPTKGETK